MEPFRVQGRWLSEADLALLRTLLAEHPHWHRTALSVRLAEQWEWRNGAGRLKDMAARTLLAKLQARGLIRLPPPQSRTRRPAAQSPPLPQGQLWEGGWLPISGPLCSLQPIALELAHTVGQRRRLRQYLQQYHYRGFGGPVGENLQYLARDAQGRELAVMVFGAAAWKVQARDAFIGWPAAQRAQRLNWVANQQRFLILPWVRVPHLASHLLGAAARRLSRHWQQRYGHPVWLVESFVETARFSGAAYRAAGWVCLGQTTGRTRQDRQRTLQAPPKAVWVCPLAADFRQRLNAP